MAMTGEDEKKLLSLLGTLCNGTIALEESAELNYRLEADVDARSLYRDYLQVHLVLVEQVRNDAIRKQSWPDSVASLMGDDLPVCEENPASAPVERGDKPARLRGLREMMFGTEWRSSGSRPFAFAATAALVLLSLGAAYLWWGGKARIGDSSRIAQSGNTIPAWPAPNLNDPGCDELFEVRDAQALRRVSQLTRTELLTSLLLPRRNQLDGQQKVTLCTGAAWMERNVGYRGRGYVIGLPPKSSLQMFVDTNAAGQNALSVFQLDDHGNMVGGSMSFNNLLEGITEHDPKNVTKMGSIGNYFDSNDGSSTKYYLLAGSYNDPELSSDDTWSQSDYKVQFRSDDVLVLGWDDTRYIPPEMQDSEDFKHDRDFNDVRAIIRIADTDGRDERPDSQVVYTPAPQEDGKTSPAADAGYTFEVAPGEVLTVMISSSATMDTAYQVCEVPSRRVIWGQRTPRTDASGESEHTSHHTYVIRNYSTEPVRYELSAQYETTAEDGGPRWTPWSYEALASEEGTATIGFRDNSGKLTGADWPGVSVHARWFRN